MAPLKHRRFQSKAAAMTGTLLILHDIFDRQTLSLSLSIRRASASEGQVRRIAPWTAHRPTEREGALSQGRLGQGRGHRRRRPVHLGRRVATSSVGPAACQICPAWLSVSLCMSLVARSGRDHVLLQNGRISLSKLLALSSAASIFPLFTFSLPLWLLSFLPSLCLSVSPALCFSPSLSLSLPRALPLSLSLLPAFSRSLSLSLALSFFCPFSMSRLRLEIVEYNAARHFEVLLMESVKLHSANQGRQRRSQSLDDRLCWKRPVSLARVRGRAPRPPSVQCCLCCCDAFVCLIFFRTIFSRLCWPMPSQL